MTSKLDLLLITSLPNNGSLRNKATPLNLVFVRTDMVATSQAGAHRQPRSEHIGILKSWLSMPLVDLHQLNIPFIVFAMCVFHTASAPTHPPQCRPPLPPFAKLTRLKFEEPMEGGGGGGTCGDRVCNTDGGTSTDTLLRLESRYNLSPQVISKI